jgi:Asp-tRNA(Asn)/Glu-tRNA(Gln) amidotransferase C subunit
MTIYQARARPLLMDGHSSAKPTTLLPNALNLTTLHPQSLWKARSEVFPTIQLYEYIPGYSARFYFALYSVKTVLDLILLMVAQFTMASRLTLARPRHVLRLLRCSQNSLHTSMFRRYNRDDPGYISPNLQSLEEGVRLEDLDDLFAKPTWSVESLLPPKTSELDAPKISPEQLHHLLRLSALPFPESPDEEKKMMDTLLAQLHFVGQMQQLDTTGVKHLRAIRDETATAEMEQTITLDTLKEALAREIVIGKHHKRIQRDPDPVDAKDVEDWDVLRSAERKAGKYFVVESERPQE